MSLPPIRVLSVVGARPNFMKIAPIARAFSDRAGRFEHFLVHTGQHYDARMSASFFDELGIPEPDADLGVGSGSHAEQTGRVMMAIEPVMADFAPDLVLTVGDVNSTLASAITARKLGFKVAHVEAGLRSGDRQMPEEINRVCTDAISDLHYTTDTIASDNLVGEGIAPERITFVGNVMIDTLLAQLERAKEAAHHRRLGLVPGAYGTLTLHRPSNVDDPATFAGIVRTIRWRLPGLAILFPVHPRTRQRIAAFGLAPLFHAKPGAPGIALCDPLSYHQFLDLNAHARIVLTDSGGLQEEATILGVPCVTLRENTERPITITQGTNHLAGTRPAGIAAAIDAALAARPATERPENWDGRAAERIADHIVQAVGPVAAARPSRQAA